MAPAEDELTALLRAVRERVRERYPQSGAGASDIALADLMPLVHARDAAEAKVAAIGTVNPRPPGLINSLVQGWKKLLARVLDWHVREQVEFNRQAVACMNATMEAFNEVNRALVECGQQIAEMRSQARELADITSHWTAWRTGWEQKLAQNEMQFLRATADLQSAFQHRVGLMEANFRDLMRSQHADFHGALDRTTLDVQKRLWADLEKVRLEYDRLIHQELRLIRLRAGATPEPVRTAVAPAAVVIDYSRLGERFRGSEDYVRGKQRFYIPYFSGRTAVLDVGCGRGEFLELMRENGIAARGIDLGEDSVAQCREKGLDAERADMFEYLQALPDGTLDGVFCAQVVEHLPPEALPELLRLCAAKLERGGVLAVETPNPGCLASLAVYFYADPTHTRPIPHALLAHYMEESGLGGVELHTLSPAVESFPALASLPEDFREAFFGGLDYALIGRKL